MMRAWQPDVPCPDNLTLLCTLQYHNHLMSVSNIQNDEMCSGIRYSASMNSRMVCIYIYIYIYMYVCMYVYILHINAFSDGDHDM